MGMSQREHINQLKAENENLKVEIAVLKRRERDYEARIKELEKANEWLPIETAPKDGTEIIITNGFEVCTGKYAKSLIQNYEPFFVESVNGNLSNDGFDWENRPVYIYKPTNWQPLPQPPKED